MPRGCSSVLSNRKKLRAWWVVPASAGTWLLGSSLARMLGELRHSSSRANCPCRGRAVGAVLHQAKQRCFCAAGCRPRLVGVIDSSDVVISGITISGQFPEAWGRHAQGMRCGAARWNKPLHTQSDPTCFSLASMLP